MKFARWTLCPLIICSSAFCSGSEASIERVQIADEYVQLQKDLHGVSDELSTIAKIKDPAKRLSELIKLYKRSHSAYEKDNMICFSWIHDRTVSTTDEESHGIQPVSDNELLELKNRLFKAALQEQVILKEIATTFAEYFPRAIDEKGSFSIKDVNDLLVGKKPKDPSKEAQPLSAGKVSALVKH